MEDRIGALLSKLTREEKARLTAGSDSWHSTPIERLGIPALKMSDGPNGVRGETRDTHPVTSASFPVGTALAATWNLNLIERIGKALGQEACSKGVHILLGPTVNMHRVPLAGRNFECFSEDPYLSARMAVAYIKGVQSEGIAACVKHFVCNDQEHERFTISAEVPERTLHEIYLPPFKAAVEEAGVYSVMSSYNKVNGTYASDSKALLLDLLKNRWGFDGMVVSDWYGTYSGDVAFNGCDLEMPGPSRWMGENALRDPEKTTDEILDDQVRRILRIMFRTGVFQRDSIPERSEDRPEHRQLIREAGSEAIVLLKNDREILPLSPARTKRVALIGQLAAQVSFQGGGSSQVAPHYLVSPLDALRDQYPGEICYAQGYDINKRPPALDQGWLVADGNRQASILVQYYDNLELAGNPVYIATSDLASLGWFGETAEYWDPKEFSLRLQGRFKPPKTGEYLLSFDLIGRGRLLIDSETVLDLWQEPSGDNQGNIRVHLSAGQIYSFTIEYACDLDVRWRTVSLGAAPAITPDFQREALDMATEADAALIFVGLTPEWESEGFDRDNLQLPGEQDQLIRNIVRVNPNTVVILNTGSAVAMPWADVVPGIVQNWYLGQESGNALADILLGNKAPSGKLPTTFPRELADTPACQFYPGENGVVQYGEGLFIGYRHYDKNEVDPLFPFGHGLSYARFTYSDLEIVNSRIAPGESINLSFNLLNSGKVAGSEIVQIYIRDEQSTFERPEKELKSFVKLHLVPGESRQVKVNISPAALEYYNDVLGCWTSEPGDFTILIGSSSRDIRLSGRIHLGGQG